MCVGGTHESQRTCVILISDVIKISIVLRFNWLIGKESLRHSCSEWGNHYVICVLYLEKPLTGVRVYSDFVLRSEFSLCIKKSFTTIIRRETERSGYSYWTNTNDPGEVRPKVKTDETRTSKIRSDPQFLGFTILAKLLVRPFTGFTRPGLLFVGRGYFLHRLTLLPVVYSSS